MAPIITWVSRSKVKVTLASVCVVVAFTPGPTCCVEEVLYVFGPGGGGGGVVDFFTGGAAATTGFCFCSGSFGFGFSCTLYFSLGCGFDLQMCKM